MYTFFAGTDIDVLRCCVGTKFKREVFYILENVLLFSFLIVRRRYYMSAFIFHGDRETNSSLQYTNSKFQFSYSVLSKENVDVFSILRISKFGLRLFSFYPNANCFFSLDCIFIPLSYFISSVSKHT